MEKSDLTTPTSGDRSSDEDGIGWVLNYDGAASPERLVLEGAYTRLEPLSLALHGDDLWARTQEVGADRTWSFLPYGPFANRHDFDGHIQEYWARDDPMAFAVIDKKDGIVRGVLALASIVPDMGVIEIGHVWFAPSLQRTRVATEAIYLQMHRSFDVLGYRRVEWKCNALNQNSCRAAERLGFVYEGCFRQHKVWKGRNRDTAWYSILDCDWPAVQSGFKRWFEPDNFDVNGKQRARLDTSGSGGAYEDFELAG